ncbi:hypothetical protein L0337_25530 [candidate division KSB1 bacterium]|nr:hypothetical protein [candidate division KSB1 bacterium]
MHFVKPNVQVGKIGAREWPRVVYVGPVKDLSRQETQHEIVWLINEDNLHTLPGVGNWNSHHYIELFPKSLYEVQASVG